MCGCVWMEQMSELRWWLVVVLLFATAGAWCCCLLVLLLSVVVGARVPGKKTPGVRYGGGDIDIPLPNL